jgi:tetratricopeptide (TPR) repeat protein
MRLLAPLLVAASLVAGVARAQTPPPAPASTKPPPALDDRAAARDHYKRGITAYNLGEYDRAVDELKKAYELSNAPSLLFNIAQALRLKRDHAQALLFYRNYLRLEPNAPNRADAEALAIEMQEKAAADERAAAEARRRADEEARAQREAEAKRRAADRGAPNVIVAQPAATPYKRSVATKWWFWTAIVGSAAVAATAISLGVAYGTSERLPMGTLGTIDGR